MEKSLLSALCRDGTCSDRQWWGLRWSVTPGTRPECSLEPRPCFRGGRRRPNRDREAWEETRKRGREGFVPPSLDHLVVSPPRACAKGSGRGRGSGRRGPRGERGRLFPSAALGAAGHRRLGAAFLGVCSQTPTSGRPHPAPASLSGAVCWCKLTHGHLPKRGRAWLALRHCALRGPAAL